MKISYGITVCNEARELQHLIEFISPLIDKEDEIVIVPLYVGSSSLC